MPKIIKDAKEKILIAAKEELDSSKDDVLSIRNIAKKADVAVGTIYHYYNDKLNLIADVLLLDWKDAYNLCLDKIKETKNLSESVLVIVNLILNFKKQYQHIFEKYKDEDFNNYYTKVQPIFYSQIVELWCCVKYKFSLKNTHAEDQIISESILFYTRHNSISFEELIEIIEKLTK